MESAVDVYKTEIIFWLKNITGSIEKFINDYETEAKRNAESAKNRVVEYTSILKTGNKPERQKKMSMLSKEKQILGKRIKCFKELKNVWENEKSGLKKKSSSK